jgi:EAL domain-containing protein (putative c-di-GMP-specific phosphodiesterase class I)
LGDEFQGYSFSKPVPADVFEAAFLAPRISHPALKAD